MSAPIPLRPHAFSCRTTAATRAQLERMTKRDQITTAQFIERVLIAYELMYPGPDYRPPENRPTGPTS